MDIEISGVEFDVALAAFLLNSSKANPTIETIANDYLGEELTFTKKNSQITMFSMEETVDEDELKYFAAISDCILSVKDILDKKLKEQEEERLRLQKEEKKRLRQEQIEKAKCNIKSGFSKTIDICKKIVNSKIFKIILYNINIKSKRSFQNEKNHFLRAGTCTVSRTVCRLPAPDQRAC